MLEVSERAFLVKVIVTECCRSPLITQLFAVVESDPFTLVAYNGRLMLAASIVDVEIFVELAEGNEFLLCYWEKSALVYNYLIYTLVCSASEPLFPAYNCSLACGTPIFAR